MPEATPEQAPKLPDIKDDNMVKEEQSKGDVRPDGPGDETAPVKPDVRDNARPPERPSHS